MPKIEITTQALQDLSAFHWKDREELETALMNLKGEVDELGGEGSAKLEFNDTNRPDLWSTAGVARALRNYRSAQPKSYEFFSSPSRALDAAHRTIMVDPALKPIRPFIVAFALSGNPISDQILRDLIQTQEKLCWNFGRKRRSIAMGVYRNAHLSWPVHYSAVDPDATKFVPLGMDSELSLRCILTEHPKGKEFGHIVSELPYFPFLTDDKGEVLSFPPIINSARLGTVEVGDRDLFVELTGTDLPSLTLAASIVACDMADLGYTILPVKVVFPWETPFGWEITFPYYFQNEVFTTCSATEKLLGLELSDNDIVLALARMGMVARVQGGQVTIAPPPYRNDFLHEVDVIEDVMMGHGLSRFSPVQPKDSTVGRLTPMEAFARKVRDLMMGLGFQEMIYNYLGSGRNFIERMNTNGATLVRLLNPMTENYEYVRNSIAPNLLESESVSANAVYPHRIFEVGKTAQLDTQDPSGTRTLDSLGFLIADRDADFNLANTVCYALAYYLGMEYSAEETDDPRFLPGRVAALSHQGRVVGVFGEVHPQVLENWNIAVPCVLGEWDLAAVFDARA